MKPMNRFEQRRLAWSLADLAAPYLSQSARNWLCAKIGAGDLEDALIEAVGHLKRNGVELTPAVASVLQRWVCGYSGTELADRYLEYVDLYAVGRKCNPWDSRPGRLRVPEVGA